MIPEQIEFLESLPKTSTGKIDRVRLAQSSVN
jgi:acyl-coenzyme A synthetase/AMP-(fatty) acid ligase